MGRSHLRWGGYDKVIDEVYPQLESSDKDFLYGIIMRDLSDRVRDGVEREYFEMMMARLDPSNQYDVLMASGLRDGLLAHAFKWEGKYYVGSRKYCAEELILSVTPRPYLRCLNNGCAHSSRCKRYLTYKEGDKVLEGHDLVWGCDKCDYLLMDAHASHDGVEKEENKRKKR